MLSRYAFLAMVLPMTAVLRAEVGAATPGAAPATATTTWKFDNHRQWDGWHPNSMIRDARFDESSVSFQASGSDPIIISPVFEWPRATNGQRVEIDIDCETAGEGEFFFTNTTQGRYDGFDGQWQVPIAVPSPGRQIVPVWPFWETLGQIVRIRFDPPSGMRCRLHSIRIVGDESLPGTPTWKFTSPSPTSWQSMYAAQLTPSDAGLQVRAARPMALLATAVEPFPAAHRSILHMEVVCPGEHTICFYWASRDQPGLWGEPIELPADRTQTITLDLRQYPEWRGTITNLAIGFGTYGREVLTLRSLAIGENDPQRPFLRLRYLGYASGVGRPGKPAELRAVLEHAAGPPLASGKVELQTNGHAACAEPTLPMPAMGLGDRHEPSWHIVPRSAGQIPVALAVNGQTFTRPLVVAQPVGDIDRGDYDVPPPRPVATDYQIGIYYFPGWSPDRMATWKRQAELPERDPLLGWYEEGRPEVADWHVKWAVENGISFFVYDWYWRDGEEQLGAALNEGFLHARYNHLMKFAIMWANHKPYASHTLEQLLTVTDYWIEHYLRRPNYLTVGGTPYISFFSPEELLTDLGSPGNVREAFEAMRARAQAAGLPGLHFGAIETSGVIEYPILKAAGFDSITAYNYLFTGTTVSHSLYRQYLIGCRSKWEHAHQAEVLPYIPLMGVGWDGPIWYGPRSQRRLGRRTADFAEGLGQLKTFLDETGQRMAILEAWNEFGEGSYIEPTLEFGFGDIEAVRQVFAKPGDWPVNVGPDDVALAGAYDLRLEPAACRAAARFGKVVETAGPNPAVQNGLTLRCWENRIAISEGEARIGDRIVHGPAACLTVAPLETRKLDLPITLQAGPVNRWVGGNRLRTNTTDRWNLLPGSFVPGSLRLVDPAHPERVFEAKRDFTVDDTWGAFAIVQEGQLKAGQQVIARYELSLRRVDALVINAAGRATWIRGEPAVDCPAPPPVPPDVLHLANVYRPFGATTVQPHHVYVITGRQPDLSPIPDVPSLAPVLAKLRAGREVTIVCWGDSVTVGGDASTPAKGYVGLFETALKERFPTATIRVINAGIGATHSSGRLPSFQQEVLDHRPDVVTLEFVNDMGLPADQLQSNYDQILARTRQAGAALVILTPHFTMPDWMGLPHGRGADPRPAVAFLRKFTRTHDVPLADAANRWDLLEHLGIPYETLLRNGINHPDDRGHRIFAEELLRFFPPN